MGFEKNTENHQILLAVQDLTVRFPDEKEGEEVIRHVELCLNRGETAALLGESGGGKTTLMRVCMGLSQERVITRGQVLLNMGEKEGFQNVLAMTRRERIKKVFGKKTAMIFQDPSVCLNPVRTVGAQLMEGLMLKKKTIKKEARFQAAVLLKEAGMEEGEKLLDLYPHQLSGGMRQRIAVLLALIPEPELLICDEPSSSLDMVTRECIFRLIDREREKRSMAVIYVTHDRRLAEERAEYVWVMYRGQIVEQGRKNEIFANPSAEYTKKLISAFRGDDKEQWRNQKQENEGKTIEPLLEAEGLCQYFEKNKKNEIKAVDGVSFKIYPGEIYGLVGSSGAGKSTIGRLIMHVHEPVEGKLILEGRDYSGRLSMKKKKELYGHVQMIFQDPAACLNPSRKVIDIVAQALDIRKEKMTGEERKHQVCSVLQAVGLSEDVLFRYPWQLSGGQRQRVGIARTIIGNPRLVIVDEAVSALDPVLQLQIADLLKEIQEKNGMTMLFISHDLHVVRRICSRIGVMYGGKIVEEGKTEEIFQNPSHEYTKSLLKAYRN